MEVGYSRLEYSKTRERLAELSILEHCHEYYVREMRADHYNKIFLIHKGEGNITDIEGRKAINAPCAIIYSAHQPFYFEEVSKDFESEVVLFDDSFLDPAKLTGSKGTLDFKVKGTRSFTNFLGKCGNYKSVCLIVEELRSELELEFSDRDILTNYLDILLLKINKAKQIDPARELVVANTNQRSHFVTHMMALVDNHFRTEKRTNFYARELCIAPNTLSKYMKKYFGKSLTQLIHDRVIMEAKRELNASEKSIKEVAYDLGFDDPLYFSRLFKKMTRVCPKVYKT